MNDTLQPSVAARLKDVADALYKEFVAPIPPVIEGHPCCNDTRYRTV
ncbi:MAG: hypothetical protein ABJO01_01210 [Parasphingorhabdus sp.]